MKRFRKVLLVGSDPTSNFLNTRLIQRESFSEHTVAVRNGREACEALARACLDGGTWEDCPDLVFIDTYMPVMDGFEFLEAYTRLNLGYSPKLVLLSPLEDRRERERAEQFGSVELFIKPLTAETLNQIREKAPH